MKLVRKCGSNKALGCQGLTVPSRNQVSVLLAPSLTKALVKSKKTIRIKPTSFIIILVFYRTKKKKKNRDVTNGSGCIKKKICRFVHVVLFTPGSRLSPPSGTAAALVRSPFADAALGTLGTAHGAAGAAAWGREGGGGTDERLGQRVKVSRPLRWRLRLPWGRGTHCPI